MWKILVILIFGLVHADTNENYKIVSCNDPNKESLNVIVFYGDSVTESVPINEGVVVMRRCRNA